MMLCCLSAHGQAPDNMVFNPSFEQYVRCPERVDALGVMTEVEAWWQPTGGSSDYFNVCGGRESAVPRNKMGYQVAHTGNAYCGIYCSQESYREYLQTELKEPLVAGRRYRVSYWVSLADKAPHAVASLGALLSATRLEDTSYNILMRREYRDFDYGRQIIATPYEPQVECGSVLADTKTWCEVSGEFVATGGERFLTIGNFRPFNQSMVIETGNANAVLPGAYYYIDDVSVVCIDSSDEASTVVVDTIPVAGTIITLGGVYFDTDQSEVLPQSYKELHHLLAVLGQYPTMKIELRGHTDNQGTVEHNQRLSVARAHAVADFLVSHGIDARRLSWRGFGKTMPVADNDTPEGRSKNRRVEYRVVEM